MLAARGPALTAHSFSPSVAAGSFVFLSVRPGHGPHGKVRRKRDEHVASCLLGARQARPAAIVRERGRRGRETQEPYDEHCQDAPDARVLAMVTVHPSPFRATQRGS
jgi:hypothetical protein